MTCICVNVCGGVVVCVWIDWWVGELVGRGKDRLVERADGPIDRITITFQKQKTHDRSDHHTYVRAYISKDAPPAALAVLEPLE